MPFEYQFIEERRKEIPNRLAGEKKGNEVAWSAAPSFQEVPSIAERLDILNFLAEPNTYVKTHAVEEYILDRVKEEGLRDGSIGYETVLNRMLERMPNPLELMMRNGQKLEILDFLLKEAAIGNKLSTQSYLKKVEEDIKVKRVNALLHQLKTELMTIS